MADQNRMRETKAVKKVCNLVMDILISEAFLTNVSIDTFVHVRKAYALCPFIAQSNEQITLLIPEEKLN